MAWKSVLRRGRERKGGEGGKEWGGISEKGFKCQPKHIIKVYNKN